MSNRRLSLPTKVFIAMVLGFIVGIAVGSPVVPYLTPVGDIFIRLIKMLVVPLIFCSITVSVAGMEDIKRFGRVGVKISLLYGATSLLAALLGVTMVTLIKPGLGFVVSPEAKAVTRQMPSLVESVVKMVPDNPVASLANMDMVQAIVFCIFLGASLILVGDPAKPLVNLLRVCTETMVKMTGIVMEFSPVGVFALMATTGAKYGFSVLGPLGKFFATEYLTMALQFFVVYSMILVLLAKVNPLEYLRRVFPVIAMTVSTTSSYATLPVTMRVAEERLGVPREIGGFTLPFGATVNMDGAALNIPIAVLFSAQAFGLSLTPGQVLTLIFSAFVMSVGTAGIPGGAIVFILMLLGQYGLPTEAFGLIIATYRIIDMGLTTMNVIGDTVCTTAVAQMERSLNRELWK